MNWKRFVVWIPLNAAFVYACVFVTWLLLSSLVGEPLRGEDGAFLQAIYAPVATLVIVIVIYMLSLLDASVLRLAFIGIATIGTEVVAFLITRWSAGPIDERLDFFVHLLAVLLVFGAWTWLRRAGYVGSSVMKS
jgi:hypothetical protein